MVDAMHRWWSEETRRSNPTPSLQLLAQAVDRFDAAMRIHIIAVAVTQALFEQITRLARAAGDPGLVTQLAAGYGGYEEAGMVAELWNVSRGALPVDAFVARYGFHGPEEGEVSAISWREDPTLVTSIADRYTRHEVAASRVASPSGRTQAASPSGEDIGSEPVRRGRPLQ